MSVWMKPAKIGQRNDRAFCYSDWLAAEGKFGRMVALRGNKIISVPIKEAIAQQSTVPLDCDQVIAARAVGTAFGDEA